MDVGPDPVARLEYGHYLADVDAALKFGFHPKPLSFHSLRYLHYQIELSCSPDVVVS